MWLGLLGSVVCEMGCSPTWGARARGRLAALASPPWRRPGLPHLKSPWGQNHPQEGGAPEPGPRLPHGVPHRSLRARLPGRVSGPRLVPNRERVPEEPQHPCPQPSPCPGPPGASACPACGQRPAGPSALSSEMLPQAPHPPPRGHGTAPAPVPTGSVPQVTHSILCSRGLYPKWPTHPVPMEPAPQEAHPVMCLIRGT